MSGENMQFEETMEEFVDNYSFNDEQSVYTNGRDLIPVYRVKQAIDHYLPKPITPEFVVKLTDRCLIYRCTNCCRGLKSVYFLNGNYDRNNYCLSCGSKLIWPVEK